jgi:hypothetical protein
VLAPNADSGRSWNGASHVGDGAHIDAYGRQGPGSFLRVTSGPPAGRFRVVLFYGPVIGLPGHGPLLTVLMRMVTSDLSAQPCRLSGANSALYWSGG